MDALLDFKNKTQEELKLYINEDGFNWVCENGYLEVAKWLLSCKPNIYNSVDNIFILVCANGHLEVMQWLISVKPDINISEDDKRDFSCLTDGYFEVMQWLLSVKPNI